MLDVQVEQIAPAHVAFVRNTGPYNTVGAAWERLFGWAGPRRLIGPALRYFGLCHDDPAVTPPDKIRYDACLVVPAGTQGDGGVGVMEFAGGEYACATHRGPYESLNATYEGLYREWLPASGRAAAQTPCVEFYLNDPRGTPPEQLLTHVCMPLA